MGYLQPRHAGLGLKKVLMSDCLPPPEAAAAAAMDGGGSVCGPVNSSRSTFSLCTNEDDGRFRIAFRKVTIRS